nr:MAG TPA: hypothetical protein [Caudoviricetes sp.]
MQLQICSKKRGSESSLNFLFLNENENVATNYANQTRITTTRTTRTRLTKVTMSKCINENGANDE